MPPTVHPPAQRATPLALLSRESVLLVSVPSVILAWTVGPATLGSLAGPLLVFLWLFGVMLWSSFSVVRHADGLAVLLGEPYGTLILTIAVITIEVVMISAVMLGSASHTTLARDTMFAVLMIVLNGMVGLTLTVGGLWHREQSHNLQGANAYMGLLFAMAGVGLVLPRFTTSAPGGEHGPLLSGYVIFVAVTLYAVFLTMQTTRHRHYFMPPPQATGGEDLAAAVESDHPHQAQYSAAVHAALLVASLVPIVLLSKKVALVLDEGLVLLGAPQALGGFLVAVLVLAPEGLGAVRAAHANHLQRAVNLCLGSALATIALTIPCVLLVSMVAGLRIELGLEPVEMVMLVLTLLVSSLNFASGRTNMMQGLVHLALFTGYVVLIFD